MGGRGWRIAWRCSIPHARSCLCRDGEFRPKQVFPHKPKPFTQPPSSDSFIACRSEIMILKKGRKLFIAEVTATISEIRTTDDNVVELPVRGTPMRDHKRLNILPVGGDG